MQITCACSIRTCALFRIANSIMVDEYMTLPYHNKRVKTSHHSPLTTINNAFSDSDIDQLQENSMHIVMQLT